jgi:hypothetical protein
MELIRERENTKIFTPDIHFLSYYWVIDDEKFVVPCRNTRVFIVIAKMFTETNIIVNVEPVISRSLSPRRGASLGCGWRNGLQYGA